MQFRIMRGTCILIMINPDRYNAEPTRLRQTDNKTTRQQQSGGLIQACESNKNKTDHRELKQLISGLAHDLNNPNTFIMLNSETLKTLLQPLLDFMTTNKEIPIPDGFSREEIPDELFRLLEGIITGSKRINTILEKLKDYLEQTHPGPYSEVELNQLTAAALAQQTAPARQNGNAINVSLAPGAYYIRGNAGQLERAVTRILENACEALPDSGGELFVTTEYLPEKKRLRIIIRDRGTGIPPEELAQVTRFFFSRKKSPEHRGLGLSLAKQIIKEHGGQLELDSRPGTGTTVTLNLPVSRTGGEGGSL